MQSGVGLTSDYFFDATAVTSRVDAADRQAMGHAGGYTRRVARGLIKRKGLARYESWPEARKRGKAYRTWREEVEDRKPSTPPAPPFTHTGALKEGILYAYDPFAHDVVVGPSADKVDQVGQLHEFGGVRFGDTYPPRPFMGPALDKAAPKFPEFWRDSIHA